MIEKDGFDAYLLICDVCGEECEEDFETFFDVVDGKKEHDWISVKNTNGWEDVCPDCHYKRG